MSINDYGNLNRKWNFILESLIYLVTDPVDLLRFKPALLSIEKEKSCLAKYLHLVYQKKVSTIDFH